jgi:hypothetical protein
VREVGIEPATTSPVLKSALKKPVPNSTEVLTDLAKGRSTSFKIMLKIKTYTYFAVFENQTAELSTILLFRYPTKYILYIPIVPAVSVPSSELGPPPHPFSRERVCPPRNQRGGTHSPAGEGMWESQIGQLGKKPSTLSTLNRLE